MNALNPSPIGAVCAVITWNRIAYARTLFESLRQHHTNLECYALVIDLPAGVDLPDRKGFAMLDLSTLHLDDESSLTFQYTPFELCCALKPFVLRYLIEQCGHTRVIYLDSDILVLAPLDLLLHQLDSADVLVTPHLDTPFPEDDRKPDDAHLLLSGTFNLGFIGVRDSPDGRAFLNWWCSKLEHGCIEDHFNGVFVDQKYIDLAVGLFEGIGIVRHPGCNVAYWNLHGRQITRDGDAWQSNGEPLLFYHFSDFDPARPELLSGHQNRFDLAGLRDLQYLFQIYCERLRDNGLEETRPLPYGFAHYTNGRRIRHAARRAFLRCGAAHPMENPFDRSTHPFAFRLAALRQELRLLTARVAHVVLKS